MKERWILTQAMHLGFLKESFGKGTVLEFDPETKQLTVDGRRFDDYRDMDVLRNFSVKHPDRPLVVEYSDEALSEIRNSDDERPRMTGKDDRKRLEVVQSDRDLHEDIDVSDTKVSVRNAERKAARKQRVKDEGLEVIRGDETAEERNARLKEADDVDAASRAERVRLLQERKVGKPKVVRDDSLGGVEGRSLNQGTVPRRTNAEAEAEAARRKREVEAKRQRMLKEEGVDSADVELPVSVVVPGEKVDPRDQEIAALREQMAEMQRVLNSVSGGKNPVVDDEVAEAIGGE